MNRPLKRKKRSPQRPQQQGGIYALKHRGRVLYVGQSVRLERRKSEHLEHLKNGTHHNDALRAIARRHGYNAIAFHVIETCHKRRLDARENYHIGRLHPTCNKVWSNGAWLVRDRRGRISLANRPTHTPWFGTWEFWVAALGAIAGIRMVMG